MDPLIHHPLEGALARTDRADTHFDELKSIIENFRTAHENQFLPKDYFQMREGVSIKNIAHPGNIAFPPLIAAVVVGDIIHNLRAALDYLIFELAVHDDPGREHEFTQFLIEIDKTNSTDRRKGFDGKKGRCLDGLSPTHIDMIESLQPYKGVTWTKTLRDISNPDKHRRLTAIIGPWSGQFIIECGRAERFKGRPGRIISGAGKDGADIYVEGQCTISIQLIDSTPLIETIEILKGQVTATIDAFKPEFKL